MWVFTKYGMYSAVCARKGDGSKANPPDPHRMMIRARDEDHLIRLRNRFPSLKRYTIKKSPHNDYCFRLIIPKWRWLRVMHGLIREQDYDNFKNEVDREFGTETPEQRRYHDSFLLSVWGVGYGYQTAQYGPGIYDKKKKDAQLTLDVPTRRVRPEDEEGSPFVEGEVVNMGVEPFENEIVLMVLDQDTSDEVCVIWSPGMYGQDERAYADAIEAGVAEIARVTWGEAKRGSAPIFDPAAQTA